VWPPPPVTPATGRRTENIKSPAHINNALRLPHYKIIDITNNRRVYPTVILSTVKLPVGINV